MKARAFSFTPLLNLLGLIAIAHLPLGLPADASFIIPSVIAAFIFIWTQTETDNLKPWMIFTLGLVADVVSSGPIGFWPLYYLSVQAAALWFGRNPTNSGLILSWIGFIFAIMVVTFLAWVVTTLYTMQNASFRPMIFGAGLVAIGYPLIYWLSGAHRATTSSRVDEMTSPGSTL